MNILVCVKQVPNSTEIKIDPETNSLIRDGVPSIVNTFDGFALEMAARIKDKREAKIVVMSMGPEQAKAALKECLAVGADKAYLVSDRAFGGSDTLATSYILSKAVRTVEAEEGVFDLIFCGKQAIDGDTAQVGPELAEHLDYPQITCITDITLEEGKIRAERQTENGKEIWEASMPAVVTVTKPDFEPRCSSVKSKIAARHAAIPVLTIDEIKAEVERIGLKGSPTKVKKTFVPPRKNGGVVVQEETERESAIKLAALLSDAGIALGGAKK
ncbi:MAG: electron transfer flavoprotein subunit beta/FixA family protein [Synergistaceae bacterium]|nr:electron transfer flavoprotein subunit beta/FixA family protein [Synergistaceae bacterium]